MEERVADIVKDFHGTPGLQSKHRLDKEKLDAVINIMSGTNQVAQLRFQQYFKFCFTCSVFCALMYFMFCFVCYMYQFC